MKKTISIALLGIIAAVLIALYFRQVETGQTGFSSAEESVPRTDTVTLVNEKNASKKNVDTSGTNTVEKEFTEQEIGEFGLNIALEYFKRQERFDHEGVTVDRIIHVNVDDACGGPDKIVLFKKNGLYAGMAKVNIEKGEMRIGQYGPGNYSDRAFDGVHIEKPYLTREEAIEQVSLLREGLTFKDYMNTCFDGQLGSYSHMPYFRFVDSNGEEFLYNIDGNYKQLISYSKLKEQMEKILAEPTDNLNKSQYTQEQVSEFFHSDNPALRLKVVSSDDSEKIYQLVYDTDPDVQRAAFLEILDHSTTSGNTYLEDYYASILAANLSYDSLLELQGFNFEQFNNLSKRDFVQFLKDSSSFALLTEKQRAEILEIIQ